MRQEDEKVQLTIPDQDLKSLSFSSHSARKFKQWSDNLPMFNIKEISSQLIKALGEIIRLKTDETTRFELLEILYPKVNYVSKSISKDYLNKPFTLPDSAKISASIAQSLESQIALAYKIVVVQATSKKESKKIRPVLCGALHRSLYYQSKSLLRCYQLYVSTPKNFWMELNWLYMIAEERGMTQDKIAIEIDKKNVFSNTEGIYKQTICLAILRPNQLRQKDIGILYDAFMGWADYISIGSDPAESDIYCVNLIKDSPPCFFADLKQKSGQKHLRHILADNLVGKIRGVLSEAGYRSKKLSSSGSGFPVPSTVSKEMLVHVKNVFSRTLKRKQNRLRVKSKVIAAYGFINAHFFLGNQTDFNTILTKKDVGVLVSNAETISSSAEETSERTYDQLTCNIVNVSSSGYCLSTSFKENEKVFPGEVVAIFDDNIPGWRLASICWMEQERRKSARIGVKIISEHMLPCAVKTIPKKGVGSEYLRAFMTVLQGIRPGESQYRLGIVVPNLNHYSGQKYIIKYYDEESEATFSKEIETGAGFMHYEISVKDDFRFIDAFIEETRLRKTEQSEKDDHEDREDKNKGGTVWASL